MWMITGLCSSLRSEVNMDDNWSLFISLGHLNIRYHGHRKEIDNEVIQKDILGRKEERMGPNRSDKSN
jgi:hypothetical protein